MTELTLTLKSPDNISLKQIIESALSERLYNLEQGIKRTQERIKQFETQYQLSTEAFLTKFNDDELNHSFDFYEINHHAPFTEDVLEEITEQYCKLF